MKHENVVWEGRFQPVHRGHLSYMNLLLEKAKHLWIVMINNETQKDRPNDLSPVPDFTAEVDSHHIPDKNPLPFWLRFRMLNETIRAEFGADAPVTVMGGHRMDLDWGFYSKALPSPRIFLTPLRDGFEDSKAKAWKDLGEHVERVDVSALPVISATEVRKRARNRDDVSDLLHPVTIALIDQYSAWDKL